MSDQLKQKLQRRATLFKRIRTFFEARSVLEVDTPILDTTLIADEHMHPFRTRFSLPPCSNKCTDSVSYFLSPSPESYMKQLLCAGSGDIFQITRSFRNGEQGRCHHPEFALLEWYRLGFSISDLMHEVEQLTQLVCNWPAAQRTSYCRLFEQHVDLNPIEATERTLRQRACETGFPENALPTASRATITEWLFSALVEKQIDPSIPLFVYHFPSEQAALARLCKNDSSLSERFELYYQGLEIANGFFELGDPFEQRRRLECVQAIRAATDQVHIPLPEKFLANLERGLPECSGVAMGLDRVLMGTYCAQHIQEVLPCYHLLPPQTHEEIS